MPTCVAHVTEVSIVPTSVRALLATPLLLALLAVSGHASPIFSAPFLSFDVGRDPACLAIADLNADGRQDMVVANRSYFDASRANVTVILGNGDGTFGTRADMVTGGSPSSVAIADLNADGRPDLAMVIEGSDAVSVLLGNGDGKFGAKTDFDARAFGYPPTTVVIGDLNGDERPDLVVVSNVRSAFFDPTYCSVLLGNGDGTFRAKQEFPGLGKSVAIADLNGDGWPDLAIAGEEGLVVSLGNGDGTIGLQFAIGPRAQGDEVRSVALADFDGDGRVDLAAVGNRGLWVQLGIGDGTFEAETYYPVVGNLGSVAIADVNGDGRPDLVTANALFPLANPSPRTVSVLLGNGNGTFGPSTDFGTAGFPVFVAIADLNGDGRPDLAAVGPRFELPARGPDIPGTVTVLLANGDGTFGTKAELVVTGEHPSSVAISDVNGDGRADVVTANSGVPPDYTGTVSVLLANGDGTFGPKTDFATGGFPTAVAIADLNADGRADLAVTHRLDHTVSVLLGIGDGTFVAASEFDAGGAQLSVAIADLNGDDRPDLAVSTGSGASVLLGNGDGTFGVRAEFAIGSPAGELAIADLNGDGRPDLTVAAGPGASVLIGNGDGTFGPHSEFGIGRPAASVAVADFNGDGRQDVAVGRGFFDEGDGTGPAPISVMLGTGDGTFGSQTDFAVSGGSSSLAIADFDADGLPDLAVTKSFFLEDRFGNWFPPGTVAVLRGNGVTFGGPTDFGTGGSDPVSVAIADLDQDGRPDMAVANFNSNTVSVHLNRSLTPAPIALAFGLTPRDLNLASRGRWVTGVLEPPSPFVASDIDVSSIRLNGTVPVDPAASSAIGDHDGNGVPDLTVKFNRAAVELVVSAGNDVPVRVTGKLGSHPVLGTAHIRVRRAVVSAPKAGSHLTAGSVAVVRWQMPGASTSGLVDLLRSLDGGSKWSVVARGLPNSGSYEWTVPSVQTSRAKLALAPAGSVDATGDPVDGVLGVSDAFSIEAPVGVGDLVPGEFALAVRVASPNSAAGGRLRVECALHDASPARLDLMDVAGRVLASRQVGMFGPGVHALELSEGGARRPGIYFLRLTQGRNEVRARAAVLR